MTFTKAVVSVSLSASLVCGAGAGLASTATARTHSGPTSTQSQINIPADQRGLASLFNQDGGRLNGGSAPVGAVAGGPASVNRQFLPAWGLRLAAKAALQVLKKRSIGMYNQVVNAVRAGKGKFLEWHAKAPGWVKAILPNVAASALWEAIRWAIGL